ncbi:mitochondrial import inner membrane translocase subunit Tim29 [Onthophagus taurus]|uniref:mitochondrial import inner membrane translocase subunit Tim29 n=1 Tax=Onthophagus taurus TaxID=166361 RepID=UPI000C2044F2|nr:mitochondrial import inner membrane translocase subunit Tim29 [Onthophagus taurus]
MFGLRTRTLAFLRTVKDHKEAAQKTANNVAAKIDAKVKGTILEKWIAYWKNVYKDYKDVAVDVTTDLRQKPMKAFGIFTGIGLATFCAKMNPDATHFRNDYLKACNDLILVHTSLQKQVSADHLKFIEHCYNIKVLRYTNLGLFSIVWVDQFSDACKIFEAECPYLQIEYGKFYGRVIDIGFLNTWWILRSKMIDYDINY